MKLVRHLSDSKKKLVADGVFIFSDNISDWIESETYKKVRRDRNRYRENNNIPKSKYRLK